MGSPLGLVLGAIFMVELYYFVKRIHETLETCRRYNTRKNIFACLFSVHNISISIYIYIYIYRYRSYGDTISLVEVGSV